MGAVGYDSLILLNSAINYIVAKFGAEPISMSKKIKNSIKSAVKFINNFEKVAANIAIENKYDYVISGHIHQPEMIRIETDKGSVMYLNSGDWIENLTALEYYDNQWHLYEYHSQLIEEKISESEEDEEEVLGAKKLFQNLMNEIQSDIKRPIMDFQNKAS